MKQRCGCDQEAGLYCPEAEQLVLKTAELDVLYRANRTMVAEAALVEACRACDRHIGASDPPIDWRKDAGR